MTRLEHTVEIDKPLQDVFALAKKVDQYQKFLPGYLESRIVERRQDSVLLARKAMVRGTLRAWKSWVRFQEGEQIHFEHAEGPLKGMQVTWTFDALSPEKTHLSIVHDLHVQRPRFIGRLLEKMVYAPRVSEMAALVVEGFKKACEGGVRV